MDDKKMLRTGDPCPCCGQPIKTKDPEVLCLLTYIRDCGVNQVAANRFAVLTHGMSKAIYHERT